MRGQDNPCIFVSYSWDSEEHKENVKKLVLRLRSAGFNVIYDGDLVPGDRLQRFMEKSVAESDIVIYICTPGYKYKADNRISGVGYENTIITSELFETQNERKFVPVLFSGTWKDSIPIWSKGKVGVDLSNPYQYSSEYRKLLETINRGSRSASTPIMVTSPKRRHLKKT